MFQPLLHLAWRENNHRAHPSATADLRLGTARLPRPPSLRKAPQGSPPPPQHVRQIPSPVKSRLSVPARTLPRAPRPALSTGTQGLDVLHRQFQIRLPLMLHSALRKAVPHLIAAPRQGLSHPSLFPVITKDAFVRTDIQIFIFSPNY